VAFAFDRHTGHRLIELIFMIKEGRYPNTRTIAEHFECSQRTAERYIERLRDFVADDLVYDPRRKGYYFARGGPDLPRFKLTEGEAVAVFLAVKLLNQCRGTPYEHAVARALSKLAYLFPKEITADEVPQLAEWVSFGIEPLRGEERQVMEAFHTLNEARSRKETVRIRYFTASRGEWRERDIDPYHLHFHDGAWYVFAYCHWRGEVKTFALDRIEWIRGTGKSFEVEPGFSPESFIQDSFRIERGEPRDVAIRFGPEQARYVRGRRWHPSQEIEELEDGGLVLRMRVGGLGEIKRWVLSFGAGAEVLGPEELVRDVRREVAGLAGRYGVADGRVP
jgi:predicted DNA-binding transcriptional regulator YafY